MSLDNTSVLEQVNTTVVCSTNTFVLGWQTMVNSYGDRLRAARKQKKFSQPKLAKISGVGQGTISKIERGDQDSSVYDVELAFALDVHPMWLKNGDVRFTPSWLGGDWIEDKVFSRSLPSIESNAVWEGEFDLWDNKTPLNDDEVAIPFFREVELGAGSGRSEVRENQGTKLRFAKSTLRKKGVSTDSAACVTVSGNSMEPVLRDGSTVGIDTCNTKICDGDMYAIDHDGHLRVKMVYKTPSGGLRLRSFNSDEWPDEIYSREEADFIKILGRLFWSANLW